MKTYFKLELKKTLLSFRTLILFLIMLVTLVIPYLQEMNFSYQAIIGQGIKLSYPSISGIDFFISIFNMSYSGFIGPIVAALIYSTSIINDKQSGKFDKLLEIIDLKTYYKAKLAVNSIVSFLIFALSHGIMLLYFIIRLGIKHGVVSDKIDGGAFINLYYTSKLLYMIIVILVISLSAVAFSTFILGVTTALEKKFISVILPLFYVVLTGIIFQAICFNEVINFNVTVLFNIIMEHTTKGLNVIIYDIVLFVLGTLLIYNFNNKRSSQISAV